MNCRFDQYDPKIHFMKYIWRSNGQNYTLALETRDGDNMQLKLNVSYKMGFYN